MLKRIFPLQDEARGSFYPTGKGPYVVHRILTRGALVLVEMDDKIYPKPSMHIQIRDTMSRSFYLIFYVMLFVMY